MSQDVTLGLQVTVLGMALVFLTLIIVMLAIMLLSRVFATRDTREGAARKPAPPPDPAPIRPEDRTNEVAALAVALALAQQRLRPPEHKAEPMLKDAPELAGEAVTLIRIEPSGGSWSQHGRLTATR